MSGAIASIVSAVNAIAGEVTLGGIALLGLATPEKVNFGGAQQIKEHKLPGGARQLQAMGPDDANPKFSGYFIGPFAANAVQSIDALRTAGQPVVLTAGGWTRSVLIKDFHFTIERGGYIMPYSVECIVIPSVVNSNGNSLLGSLTNDLTSALGIPTITATG